MKNSIILVLSMFSFIIAFPQILIAKNSSVKIIGGFEAEPHSIPYQTLLHVHGSTLSWYCGGALISENYVLTAAHCVDGSQEVDVILGAHSLTEPEDTKITLTTKEIKIHEEFSAVNVTNDLALLRLSSAVTFNDAILPVKLPSRADSNNTYLRQIGRVAGWGQNDTFVGGMSQVLNYVDVDIISNDECAVTFNILPSNLCTSGHKYTGPCYGDAGSPLVVDQVLVGIVSQSLIFCLYNYPTTYARMTNYLDWIEENSDVVIANQSHVVG